MNYYPNTATKFESISLNEFNQQCESYGAITCIADYEKLIPLLRRLAKNPDIFENHNCEPFFKQANEFKRQHKSMHSMMIADLQNCEIHAVFWPLATGQSSGYSTKSLSTSINQNRLSALSYFGAHNHNFQFMSIGYRGPGYVTDIYQYDASNTRGFVGESVDINFMGTFTLGVGDIMIFEENSDIHTHIPPKDFSISINLIPKQDAFDRQGTFNPQYSFDLSTNQIAETINGG